MISSDTKDIFSCNQFVQKNKWFSQINSLISLIEKILDKKRNVISSVSNRIEFQSFNQMINTLYDITPKSESEKILLELLLDYSRKVQSVSTNDVEWFIRICLEWIQLFQIHDLKLNKSADELIEEYNNLFLYNSEFINNIETIGELRTLINDIKIDEKSKSVLFETLLLAGTVDKIIVEDTYGSNYKIEQTKGCSFALSPHLFFLGNQKLWKFSKCKVFVIDGSVESVGEIHTVLQQLSKQDNIPLVIIARSFAEEVIATLKINYQNKKLNVLPVIVDSSSLELSNAFADLSMVTGKECISFLKGDRISTVPLADIPVVDQFIATEGRITIINEQSEAGVATHVRSLIQKKNVTEEVELVEILDKRIKSLISNSVKINIPRHLSETERKNIKMNIDFGFKTIRSSLVHGFIDVNKLHNWLKDNSTKNQIVDLVLLSVMKKYSSERISVVEFFASLWYFVSFVELMQNLGGILEVC